MARQINGYRVDARVRRADWVNRMKSDAELFRVNRDQKISIILVVIILQHQTAGLYDGTRIEVADFRAFGWLLSGLAVLALHESIRVVATIAAHDERHIEIVSAEGH